MSWIHTIDYQDSEGKLRKLYDRVRQPDGYIDSILLVHSLRPHTLQGHMMLYKNVLHHQDNALGKWFLESIGVLVSLLNQCTYCVEQHFVGLKKLCVACVNIRSYMRFYGLPEVAQCFRFSFAYDFNFFRYGKLMSWSGCQGIRLYN